MASDHELNEYQQAAVDHPHNTNAIVTAAAGSGKTTLLVARVIRLLSDISLDIPADSLAVMTFTKNATASMREKLNDALAKELTQLDDKTSAEERERYDYLKKQMFALRQASISTIDAFCLRMIKENAEAFELPLNFTIADDAKKAALQSQAMRAALQEFYGADFSDEERDALFYSFSFEDDRALEEAVFSVSDKLLSLPDPDKWIGESLDAYKDICSVEKSFLPLIGNFLELNVRRAELCVSKYSDENIYDRLAEEVEEKRANTKGKSSSLDDMENDVLPAVKRYIEFDEKRIGELKKDLEAYRSDISITKLNALMKNLEDNSADPPELFNKKGNNFLYKKLFNRVSKDISDTVGKLLNAKFDGGSGEDDLPAMQNAMRSFFKLLKTFMNCYELEKMTAGCIDFSDCERVFYEKLSENGGDNNFRKQLSQRFKCIIVDEFQDSNKIQAEIFRLLGDGHLFYVGDVKQSIYSFRGADPYIMAGLCGSSDSGFKTLPLNTNYRSRKAVINTVNAAFDGLMTPKFGGVDYSDNNGLNLGCDLPEPQHKELYDSEICLITGAKQETAEDEKDKDMTLPRYVARRIKELCGNENFLISDGKDENKVHKFRRAEYSDVIILLRTKGKIDCYRKALKELGIPSTAPKGSNFFEADEILLAYNYLKVIDNPLLNEEMLKVLMSPIYRFTAEETAQLKTGILGLDNAGGEELRTIANTYKRRSLYSCITDCMSQKARRGKEKISVKRAVSPKLERFYNDLRAFRYYMNSSSLSDLVRKIYEDTDLIAVVAAFEDSAGRVENIRQLQRLASEFEESRGGGLGDFLRFFDRAKESSSKGIEEAARPENSPNAVRIMTFHGSKGLEAPICIMSELQNPMNSADYSGDLLVNFEHFAAMKHTDIKHRRKTKPITYHALSRFIRERQLGDELRLLYVAMTRAQEKLIMVSSFSRTNYDKFNEFINRDTIDPDLHDEVYETSTPFNCVLNTILQYAPMIGGETKELSLDKIGCKITAVDSNAKPKTEEPPENGIGEADKAEFGVSEEDVLKITELMKLKYEHTADTAQQAKFTTTELAHKKSAKPISLTKPVFASGGAVSGVEKGNAYHHCMQHFPFDRINTSMSFEDTLAAVTKAIDELTEKRKLTADERKIVEAERVAKFFTSELGQRMLRVYSQDRENVKREQSFYAEVNGTDVRQNYESSISIQGQVDLFFIENGEIVVVDYKSDTIENLAKEQKNYEFQVEIYTKILKKLTGMNVREMYLYAFLADKEMKI